MNLTASLSEAVQWHRQGRLQEAFAVYTWVSDMRWLLDRTDSPWYPAVKRLFRQGLTQLWANVLCHVQLELEKLLGCTPTPRELSLSRPGEPVS